MTENEFREKVKLALMEISSVVSYTMENLGNNIDDLPINGFLLSECPNECLEEALKNDRLFNCVAIKNELSHRKKVGYKILPIGLAEDNPPAGIVEPESNNRCLSYVDDKTIEQLRDDAQGDEEREKFIRELNYRRNIGVKIIRLGED